MIKGIPILLFIFLNFASYGQLRLEVEITDLRNNKGNIMIQLFDSSEKVLSQQMNPIKDNRCSTVFTDLKSGKYAVRYYHDENLNGKMETNVFGKPTEGYGFSNNVTGKFGPPAFTGWLFEMKANAIIVLKPTY